VTAAALLRTERAADAARPLITFYDDASGERVELSVATFDNWVAKTANLVQDELAVEPGARLALLLPLHWQAAVWLFAAWSCGLVVAPGANPADADLVVCGPEDVERAARSGGDAVALSLQPLGARFSHPLPGGVLDYAVELPGQGDRFAPASQVDADAPALELAGETWSQAELLSAAKGFGPDPGERILTMHPYDGASGVRGVTRGLLAPITAHGSIVQCRNQDPALLAARIESERVTATLA
jgi:uncharacterized protein (TIGR03089 family)